MIKYRVLSGEEASQGEVDVFVKMVGHGGAVDEHFVREGLARPGAKIVFAEMDGVAVGVAALKIPSDHYRAGLEAPAKSGQPLPSEEYPYELGYVSVSPKFGKRGIGRRLVETVLDLAKDKGMFATTGKPAMKERILPSFGFVPSGNTWNNKENNTLQLFVRNAQKKQSKSG